MFNPTEYPATFHEQDARDRADYEIAIYDETLRMEAFDAGLCSLGAAIEGGARYERELAESALELREEAGIPAPIAAAVNGWLGALATARKLAA